MNTVNPFYFSWVFLKYLEGSVIFDTSTGISVKCMVRYTIRGKWVIVYEWSVIKLGKSLESLELDTDNAVYIY